MRVGLLAGTGRLPELLREAHDFHHIIDLEQWPEPLGALLIVVEALKSSGCEALVLAGAVNRARFDGLDAGGTWVAERAGLGAGDGQLLDALVAFFELEGFQILGATDLDPTLITPQGQLAGVPIPDPEIGLERARALGLRDLGQAVIQCDGSRWLEETAAGTNDLIVRAGEIEAKERVLYKAAKPQQDLRVDMPSWGLQTVELAAQHGVRTLVFEAGKTIALDREQALLRAEEIGVSVLGVGS